MPGAGEIHVGQSFTLQHRDELIAIRVEAITPDSITFRDTKTGERAVLALDLRPRFRNEDAGLPAGVALEGAPLVIPDPDAAQ